MLWGFAGVASATEAKGGYRYKYMWHFLVLSCRSGRRWRGFRGPTGKQGPRRDRSTQGKTGASHTNNVRRFALALCALSLAALVDPLPFDL